MPIFGGFEGWQEKEFVVGRAKNLGGREHFLGAGAPLGLAKLVSYCHKKVSKSNILFPRASTNILILVTCYLKPDTYYLILVTLHMFQVHVTWYFHLLFVTLFLLNLIHLILYLLCGTYFLIIFTCYLLLCICHLILIT